MFKNRLFCGAASITLAVFILFIDIHLYCLAIYGKVQALHVVQFVPNGSVISERSVKLVELGDLSLPDTIVCNLADVIGRKAKMDLVKGDLILETKLEERGKSNLVICQELI